MKLTMQIQYESERKRTHTEWTYEKSKPLINWTVKRSQEDQKVFLFHFLFIAKYVMVKVTIQPKDLVQILLLFFKFE